MQNGLTRLSFQRYSYLQWPVILENILIKFQMEWTLNWILFPEENV